MNPLIIIKHGVEHLFLARFSSFLTKICFLPISFISLPESLSGDIGPGMPALRERGSTVVAEICFSTDSCCEKAVTEGITVGGRRLLHYRPLTPNSQVLKLAVSDVPLHYSMEEIQQNIADSMSKYGCILDMNLFTTSQGGWFKGRGVVYLDVGNTSRARTHCFQVP